MPDEKPTLGSLARRVETLEKFVEECRPVMKDMAEFLAEVKSVKKRLAAWGTGIVTLLIGTNLINPETAGVIRAFLGLPN